MGRFKKIQGVGFIILCLTIGIHVLGYVLRPIDTDGAFYLVEDDDFEPVADWYSSEIVLDMFTRLCNDLRAEGIHFGASVYGLSF